jgi:hypothetical protein
LTFWVTGQKVVNRNSPLALNEGREAVEVTLPVSMHTGQIIMLTKMLTTTDLRFYDLSGDGPRERWHSGQSRS